MNDYRNREELKKRYIYLKTNAIYLLAPFMHQETKKENKMHNRQLKKEGKLSSITLEPRIYLENLDYQFLRMLEEFMLSDDIVEESFLYINLERLLKEPEFLKKVNDGIKLLKMKKDKYPNYPDLNFHNLLQMIRKFSIINTEDKELKSMKSYCFDEYDSLDNYINSEFIVSYSHLDPSWYGDNQDMRVEVIDKTGFIAYVGNPKNYHQYNKSLLTDKEQQEIYLMFHDELPWDLEVPCTNGLDDNLSNNECCGSNVNIKESLIFTDTNKRRKIYYQMCPNCGNIIRIPSSLLPEGVRKRVIDNCRDNPYLLREMQLRSELAMLYNKQNKKNR